MGKPIEPPRWADRFLEWYCRKMLLEDLQGDLYEFFDRNVEKRGRFMARLIYIIDVLKFFRIYTVQKPKIFRSMNSLSLLSNYFKTSIRSIARNKLFSSINVFGLAVSMSVCLLMIAFISDILKFDQFHDKKDRIFRVNSHFKNANSDWDLASSPATLGEELTAYSAFEEVVAMRRSFSPDVFIADGSVFQLRGHYVNDSFLKMFSFDGLEGDINGALSEPNTLVITKSTANKMFQGTSAVGQVVKIDDDNYTIKAVVQDPPKHSHFQFEVLGSFITYQNKSVKNDEKAFKSWTNMWMYHSFVLLREGVTKDQALAILNEISDRRGKELSQEEVSLNLHALPEIAFGEDISNESGVTIEAKAVMVVALLALVVIITASFNYTNLSIAKSLRRAKEIGVRKVVGASRWNVFTQFITEAVVISMASLVIAVAFYYIIKGEFLDLNDEIAELSNLDTSLNHILLFILFAIVVGMLSGFFPALVLSKLKALLVLKDMSKTRLFSAVSMRKILIVLQFTISLIFIISASIIYSQFKYALNYELGYNTENIVNVEVNDPEKLEKLALEMEKIPAIKSISKSTLVQGIGSIYTCDVKYKDPLDSINAYYNGVDLNYFENFDHELLAGSNFPPRSNFDNELHVIVDERTLKRFKIGEPHEAIGEKLEVDENQLEIVGVMKDFMYTNIEGGEPKPTIFRNVPSSYYWLNLKIQSTDVLATFDQMEDAWRKVDEIHPFEAHFYDEQIERSYQGYMIMFKIVGFLAFIAISISLLGLLGMVVYTTETKIKEISIRKVLGATEKNLVFLLSRGFFIMLIIACGIAIPGTYLFFEEVYFSDQVYHINLNIFHFLTGILIMFGTGLVVIGWQTTKAARGNPAQSLRTE